MLIYLLLKPVYLWDSGLPQVADLAMVTLIAHHLGSQGPRLHASLNYERFSERVRSFVLYVLLVNLVAAIAFDDPFSFLRSALFYVYNAVVAVVMLSIFGESRESFRRTVFVGALSSISIQVVLILVTGGGETSREAAQFNNPNQLAAFAVLVACLLLITQPRTPRGAVLTQAGLVLCGTAVLMSLSRAGMMAFALVIVVNLVMACSPRSPRYRTRLVVAIYVVLIIVAFSTWDTLAQTDLIASAISSITTPQNDDTLTARGYGRILAHPEYWTFGGGEGAHDRFEGGMELHSMPGTIFAAYGLVGAFLFLRLIAYTIRRGRFPAVATLAIVTAYGLTHNPLRNTLLWILLALLVGTIPDDGARRRRA